jgi:hypothetical protein
MPTICPNCLRPVRSEARFCGYCGSNLGPATVDEETAILPVSKPGEIVTDAALPKSKPKPKPNAEKIRRRVLIGIVILLCLVLIAAFLIHYLPLIGSYLGALFTLFLAR